MSKKNIIYPFLIFFAASAFAGIGSPTAPVSARPPMSSTTPVSSYSSGSFLTAPSSSSSSNLVITGNVPGLSYFHGATPYTSRGSFLGRLESTSLDSFRRYSAPAGIPFYSSTASPQAYALSQSLATDKIRLPSAESQTYVSPALTQTSSVMTLPSSPGLPVVYNRYQGSLLAGVSGYRTPQTTFVSKPSSAVESLIEPRQPLPLQTEQLRQSLSDFQKTLDSLQPIQTIQVPLKPSTTDQIKEQIEKLNKLLEQQSATEQANKKIEETVQNYWKEKLKTASGDYESVMEQINKLSAAGAAASNQPSASQDKTGKTKTPPTTWPTQQHFEQMSAEQMLTGYKLLKEQKFYQAADAFNRASLYNPSDPNSYTAKALALFAAGDYIFASQSLSIALERSPDYAKTVLNLADLLGSKTLLDQRAADLQKYANQNNSPKLYFLLAFIQFKTGQLPQAKASIDQALKLFPDELSFKSLKSAIDSPTK